MTTVGPRVEEAAPSPLGGVAGASEQEHVAGVCAVPEELFESGVNPFNASHVFRRFGKHDMDNIIAFDAANKALEAPLDRKVMCSSLMWSAGTRV